MNPNICTLLCFSDKVPFEKFNLSVTELRGQALVYNWAVYRNWEWLGIRWVGDKRGQDGELGEPGLR